MRLVLPGIFHRDEAVDDIAQVREVFQGHLYGDLAFGGDDGDLYVGVAQAGERLFDMWELLDQGVVVLFVVAAVGLEQEFGPLGVYELHLAREGLADVGEECLSGYVVTAQDRARGVAHGLVDHLRRVDERPVEIEEGGLEQSLVEPVLEEAVHVPGSELF